MGDTLKLVPVIWNTWNGDWSTEYEVPNGWEYVDVKDFKDIGGNNLQALVVLRKVYAP